ncbi:DNA-binding transcriptional regulator, MarR family [Streptoalloteichus tenebrarius]|uniref:DNA-binding transcriptional regulator, MarR family n=1 Tax=Streptoalloteichus tenebrarius (strain ATCC 17920 / DSM 40477 / JCM 4838 / CBS 697.72 / NBRC 16177 / NCIMB 11028 / NRRL B-12390 / A12253. 1 / ISP 5477) TaxID=1933 RepID=A0ABT1I0W3_STRSD|nr:MarR family transcriptional regulator [Streptoalloteichus tenebrarius]MCP2261432.1 DNA-binding transcriptional regulator, MarR family [Streptoalloteichus tenebrarius]BFF02036.1 MarR family transcriptional regulator [Streptoalloteichus tenebrarius]
MTADDGIAELAHRLRPLVFRLYYVVRRETPQYQLTLTQGSVLAALVLDGPQRMSALAEREGVRTPSMTDVVGRLERLGLVRRGPDPTDGRAVIASATEEGRRLIDELVRAREEFLRARLARLDDADRAAITAALPAFERLAGVGGTPAPDQAATTDAITNAGDDANEEETDH